MSDRNDISSSDNHLYASMLITIALTFFSYLHTNVSNTTTNLILLVGILWSYPVIQEVIRRSILVIYILCSAVHYLV